MHMSMTQKTQTYYTVVYLMPTQYIYKAFSFHYLPNKHVYCDQLNMFQNA